MKGNFIFVRVLSQKLYSAYYVSVYKIIYFFKISYKLYLNAKHYLH